MFSRDHSKAEHPHRSGYLAVLDSALPRCEATSLVFSNLPFLTGQPTVMNSTSNNLNSVHEFGFRPSHSTFDMLLPLTQQWMQALNVRSEIRAVSLNLSRAFNTVWHPAVLSKLSAFGIQGQRHTWLPDSSIPEVNVWHSTESFHLLSSLLLA